MKPGDPVLLSGTYSMGGIGLEDDECLVEMTGGQFVKVRERDLAAHSAEVALVRKDDLRYLITRLPSGDPHRPALEAALGEYVDRMPEPGDVWRDGNGVRWFCRHGASGELHLASENMMGTVSPAQAFSRGMFLEWRREW